MNTLDALYSRKSIRSFNGEPATQDELNEILKSAYASPVGRAKYETLHITVISNKDFLTEWESLVATVTRNPDLHPFYNAPTVILVSSEVPNERPNVNYSNAAIIAHNMAICATELGVGACHIWGAVAMLPASPKLIKRLNIPDGMKPCCALAIGQTDEKYTLREIDTTRIKTAYLV